MFNVKYEDFINAVEKIKRDILIHTNAVDVEIIINGNELIVIGIDCSGKRTNKIYKLKDYIEGIQ